jgi:hypothetical protein
MAQNQPPLLILGLSIGSDRSSGFSDMSNHGAKSITTGRAGVVEKRQLTTCRVQSTGLTVVIVWLRRHVLAC